MVTSVVSYKSSGNICSHIESTHSVYTLASTNDNQSAAKLGQNVCDRKILKEFNYEPNRERKVRIICPVFKKLLYLTLFTPYHLQI